jgi:hypothetical protein
MVINGKQKDGNTASGSVSRLCTLAQLPPSDWHKYPLHCQWHNRAGFREAIRHLQDHDGGLQSSHQWFGITGRPARNSARPVRLQRGLSSAARLSLGALGRSSWLYTFIYRGCIARITACAHRMGAVLLMAPLEFVLQLGFPRYGKMNVGSPGSSMQYPQIGPMGPPCLLT